MLNRDQASDREQDKHVLLEIMYFKQYFGNLGFENTLSLKGVAGISRVSTCCYKGMCSLYGCSS